MKQIVLVAIGFVCAMLFIGAAQAQEAQNNALTNCIEPFDVKDCTGPAAGKTLCYYCRYGFRPVVCIFAKHLDDSTAKLIAKIDAIVAERKEQRLAAFFVLLGGDTQANEKRLKEIAGRHKIRRTPLTIYRDTPEKLKERLRVSGESSVTIRWWSKGAVIGQHVENLLDESKLEEILKSIASLEAP